MPRVFAGAARWSAFGVGAVLAALSVTPAIGPAQAADDVIRLLTWPTYTHEEVLAEFTAESGVRVEVTVAQSNEEMAAAIRAGDPAYDVVVPSDSWVALLAEEDLLVPFDATTLEGFERIDDPWLGAYFDPGMLYSIPFLWGTTSFMVNTELYDGTRDSLALLFEPPEEVRGKVGMMTDARDSLDLALRYLGLPACTDDPDHMARVRALLDHQATFIFDYTMDSIVTKTARGDLAVQMIYNGAAMRAREANPAIAYVYPKEGVTVWSDNLVMPVNARNKDGARTFLEFFLRPEVIAAHSNQVRYGNTIRGSQQFLDDDLKDAPELLIPPDVPINFVAICDDDVVAGYTALWREITGIEE